jgi:hypothetical protein
MALLPQAIVQCEGFRCLAFKTTNGWIDSHGDPLEVVRVINVIFDPTTVKKE